MEDQGIALERQRIPGNRLLVKRLEPDDRSAGGIFYAEASKEDKNLCVVLKLSEKYSELTSAGAPIVLPKVGDLVLINKHCLACAAAHCLGPPGEKRQHIIDIHDVLDIIEPEVAHA